MSTNSIINIAEWDYAKYVGRFFLTFCACLLFPTYLMVGVVQHEAAQMITSKDINANYSQVIALPTNVDDDRDKLKDKRKVIIEKEQNIRMLEAKIDRLSNISSQNSNGTAQDNSITINSNIADNKARVQSIYDEIEIEKEGVELLKKRIALISSAEPVKQTIVNAENTAPFRWVCSNICPLDTPPSLLPFFLIFFSGFFGAILFQMILIVYPNSELRTDSSKHYSMRIILGGVIAMAMFVVLASGSAVLGSNEALFNARANIYSLSAIGILAGMFSNRVAGWLSNRAKNFMAEQDQ